MSFDDLRVQIVPASSALRKEPRTAEKPKPRLFHARMVVTRVEEWCVEAETAAEAEALLVSGAGHRCAPGESIQVELEQLIGE